jgi:hypothetical protein
VEWLRRGDIKCFQNVFEGWNVGGFNWVGFCRFLEVGVICVCKCYTCRNLLP